MSRGQQRSSRPTRSASFAVQLSRQLNERLDDMVEEQRKDIEFRKKTRDEMIQRLEGLVDRVEDQQRKLTELRRAHKGEGCG